MSNSLNYYEQTILCGAVADLRRYQAATPSYVSRELRDATERVRALESHEGLVRVDAARWLGCSIESPAKRMNISRSYASLQRRLLIERHAMALTDKRTTHLKPTEAGIALADQLTTPAEAATTSEKESQ